MNRRRELLSLLVSITLVLSGWARGACCRAQDELQLKEWLSSASDYYEKREFYKAKEAIEMARRLYPDDPRVKELERKISEALGRGGAAGVGAGVSPAGGEHGAVVDESEENTLLEYYAKADSSALREELGRKLSGICVSKARRFVSEGKDEEAIVELRKAYLFDPSNHWAYYELFGLLRRKGRTEEALEYGERFLRLQSLGAVAAEVRRELVESYERLASAYASISRWDRAVSYLERAVKLADEPARKLRLLRDILSSYCTLCNFQHTRRQYAEASDTIIRLLAARRKYLEAAEEARRAGVEVRRDETVDKHVARILRVAPSVLWQGAMERRKHGALVEARKYLIALERNFPAYAARKNVKAAVAGIDAELVSPAGGGSSSAGESTTAAYVSDG